MWGNFESCVNEEETVTHAFCTNGLFKISSDEPVLSDPKVQAALQDEKMLVSVDKSLILLENENIAECRFLSFATQIECVEFSNSGNLVICALSDGTVYGVYIKGVPVFNLVIQECDIGVNGTFVGISQIDNFYYLICASGSIYKLHHIDEKVLAESIANVDENQTSLFNETLINNVILEKLPVPSIADKINGFSIISISKESCNVVYCGSSSVYIRIGQTVTKIVVPKSFHGVKSVYNLDNFIIGLSNSGDIFEICPYTGMIFPCKTDDLVIDDIVVMECTDDAIELLILTKQNTVGKRVMKIIDYPSMTCKYDLAMPENTWLVRQPKSSVNMYYVGGNCLDSQYVQEIEMKIISETQPSQRFKKLIQKGHLNEAEEFAKQFGLSLQPIYEARSRKISIDISSIINKNTDELENKLDELINILKMVEDKRFLLNFRISDIPDRKLLTKFLQFLLEQLQDSEHKDDLDDINEQLRRLETLNLIDPSECNMEWQQFIYDTQLIKTCMKWFKTDITVACLVWARHSSSVVPNLKEKVINTILAAIPTNIEPFQVIQWLNHFVPSVLQSHSGMMTLLVDWSIARASSLQHSNLWPEIGLEFSNNILSIFSNLQFLLADINRKYEKNIGNIQTLINALQDLTVLKKSYNLNLTLSDYTKDSIEDTAFYLLQRAKDLPKMVDDFLYPIFMEKGLSPVSSIVKYIKFLITNRKNIRIWQERAVDSIELLHNEEERLECALLVLKSANVPWSDVLNPLVRYGSSNHPFAREISIQYELQNIKLIRVKYGWPADVTENNMKLVFRIMLLNLPTMMQDIRDLVRAAPEISQTANVYCIFQLALKGEIEKGIKYLDSLEDKLRIDCIDTLKTILTINIDENQMNETEIDYLIEFLKLINTRNPNHSQDYINLINNLLTLRHKFKLTVNLQSITNQSNKIQYLYDGIDFIILRLKAIPDNLSKEIWSSISSLTTALSMNKLTGFYVMSKLLDNINFTCWIANLILETIDVDKKNSEYFIKFSVLILVQQIKSFNHGQDGDCLPYPLAYKLLIEALKFDKINYLEIVELLRWVRIGNSLYSLDIVNESYDEKKKLNEKVLKDFFSSFDSRKDDKKHDAKSKKRESMSIFENVVKSNEVVRSTGDPFPVIKCIGLAIKTIITELYETQQKLEPPFNRIRELLVAEMEEPGDGDLKADFSASLEHLLKIKQHSSLFAIIQHFMRHQEKSDKMIVAKPLITIIHKKMLKYSLNQLEPSIIECIAVLQSDTNPEQILSYLETEFKTGHQKVNFLALSEFYHSLKDDEVKLKLDKESRMKHFYYTELCKADSSLKSRSEIEFVSYSQLIKELGHKMLDVGLLEKMSIDFSWDYQKVLITQVIAKLNMQDLNFTVQTDVFGKEEIVIKTSVDEIRKMCQPYINEITNLELLGQKLLAFLNEINFYFYEMYLCVLEMLSSIKVLPKEMNLWSSILLFLKHKMTTKRRNRANQLEMDWWLKSQTDVGVLPKIAKYRFPFKPIVEEPLKNILEFEVSVDNCDKWFPLIKLHAAMQNVTAIDEIFTLQEYFCMQAVKNSSSEYKIQNEENELEVWHLKPINNAFLQSILRLVSHIHDISKTLFVLYFITNNAPEGADQVEAAYECYKFAMKHESALMQMKKNSPETVQKIKRKYPIFKTQHLLHLYGLAEEKLFQFVESPNELIVALYNHELILKTQKPDINKVASEIADLHEINLNEIQQRLIEKWLSFSADNSGVDADDTFYEEFNTVPTSFEMENYCEEFTDRAHYILSSWPAKDAIEFLVAHLITVDGAIDTGSQLQVFECFTKLIDDMDDYDMDALNQNNYIAIKCVHYLKQLGYNFKLDKFKAYEKINFLKRVWQSHGTEPKALEVISFICLGFNIDIPQIWNGVLKQMVNLNMTQTLSSLIHFLSTKSCLLHIDGLAKAWEHVINVPFKIGNRTWSIEQDEAFCKSLILLQTCPVTSKINLVQLAEDCIRLDRIDIASILIAFARVEQKEEIVKMLEHSKKEDLKLEIIKLEGFGVMSVITNSVINILKL